MEIRLPFCGEECIAPSDPARRITPTAGSRPILPRGERDRTAPVRKNHAVSRHVSQPPYVTLEASYLIFRLPGWHPNFRK